MDSSKGQKTQASPDEQATCPQPAQPILIQRQETDFDELLGLVLPTMVMCSPMEMVGRIMALETWLVEKGYLVEGEDGPEETTHGAEAED